MVPFPDIYKDLSMKFKRRSPGQSLRTCFGLLAVLAFALETSFLVRSEDAEFYTLHSEFPEYDGPPSYLNQLWGIYNLIPFPLKKEPEQILEINYFDKELEIGRFWFPLDLRYPPTRVAWPKQYVRSYYTLIMTDLDYPAERDNSEAEYLHWMVGNIEGPPENRQNETIVQYIGPYPKQGTGLHRYVFYLFRQPKKIKWPYDPILSTFRNESRRRRFSTRRFASKHKLGMPEAFTFFLGQFWHQNTTVTDLPSVGDKAT
nr:PREDICTED: protein D1-like isoform X1 [Bemisia tabaci]